MTMFVWVVLCLFVVATLGKLTWLYQMKFPPRTKETEVIDVVFFIGLIVWACVLLFGAAR